MAASARTDLDTVADLLVRLGGISPDRVLLTPPPGKATERHLLKLVESKRCLCELIDGVLVAKSVGFVKGFLHPWVMTCIHDTVDAWGAGCFAGCTGPLRLRPGLVYCPDLSFPTCVGSSSTRP